MFMPLKIMNLIILVCALLLHYSRVASVEFSATYVFGDSLVDNGNNNYINSGAKANFYPYGIDFYQGPTGRFTNGKTCIDFLAELLGHPYIPAYAYPFSTDRDILYGVNYASAAGGVLAESGQGLGERANFRQQVDNFGLTKRLLQNQMSDIEVQKYLARALALVILGSNDYVNNYLNPSYGSQKKFKPDKFADIVISEYVKQIARLYDQGLRLFFLANVGPIGCSPSQRTTVGLPGDKCVPFSNDAVQLFNTRLRDLVDRLNVTYRDATFTYGDIFQAITDIIDHPKTFGLTEIVKACCGVGRNNAEAMCLPLLTPCFNRDQYAFWDAFHPTQVVHRFLALTAYNGPKSLAHPYNIKQMLSLHT